MEELIKNNIIFKMSDFIRLINHFHKDKKNYFLFRGQEDSDYHLNSSWLRENNDYDIKSDDYKIRSIILRGNIMIFNDYIKEIKSDKNYSYSALQILASLQHSKDVPTPLIDFTDDILLAFWFALGTHKGNCDASLFVLKTKFSNIEKNMDDFKQEYIDKIYESPYISNRALSQRSYFIVDYKNWEEDENVNKIIIKKDCIKEIQKYLENKNKSHTSVYPDLKGKYLNAVKSSTIDLIWRSINYSKKGEHGKAIEYIDKAIALNPDSSTAYNNRGIIKNNINLFKDAIRDYNKAIELNPNFEDAYYNRGISKNNMNLFEEAIEDLNKAIELSPNFEDAYYKRGISKNSINLFEEAIKDFNKAIELDSNFATAYNYRGISKYIINLSKEAIKDFDKAIELEPGFAGAYINRGIIKSNINLFKEAIEDLEMAKKLGVPKAEKFIKEIKDKLKKSL